VQAGNAENTAGQTQTNGQPMIHQLRIYEIFDRNKTAFHDRFRDHAARIMRRYDFHIVAMWEAKGEQRTEFVYLLQWPDAATMEQQWARFMADKEWSELKKKTAAEHGQLVGGIQSRVLQLTDYSPRLE
jgi:hypothetical protein